MYHYHFRYADTDVQDFDIWNVRRDVLMSKGLLPDPVDKVVVPTPRPTQRPAVNTEPQPSSDDAGRDSGKCIHSIIRKSTDSPEAV